jgi:hypothetical protein
VPWESRDSHLLDGQSNVRRSHGDVGSLGLTTTGDAIESSRGELPATWIGAGSTRLIERTIEKFRRVSLVIAIRRRW